MPLPALAVAALPLVTSAIGSMLHVIVDAFRTGKSPEEAQKIIAPKRQEIVDRLMGSGMNKMVAETMADESMRGELEKAQLPEPMNPWLAGALAIGGGVAGYKLGKMGAGKMGAKAPAPKEQAKPEPSALQAEEVYHPGFTSPRAEAMRRGAGDRVTGMGEPRRLGMDPTREVEAEVIGRGPFPSPAMDPDFAALNMGGQVPGRNTRRFTMRDDGPFPSIGISPELENAYVSDAMRQRMYRYEGG